MFCEPFFLPILSINLLTFFQFNRMRKGDEKQVDSNQMKIRSFLKISVFVFVGFAKKKAKNSFSEIQ